MTPHSTSACKSELGYKNHDDFTNSRSCNDTLHALDYLLCAFSRAGPCPTEQFGNVEKDWGVSRGCERFSLGTTARKILFIITFGHTYCTSLISASYRFNVLRVLSVWSVIPKLLLESIIIGVYRARIRFQFGFIPL